MKISRLLEVQTDFFAGFMEEESETNEYGTSPSINSEAQINEVDKPERQSSSRYSYESALSKAENQLLLYKPVPNTPTAEGVTLIVPEPLQEYLSLFNKLKNEPLAILRLVFNGCFYFDLGSNKEIEKSQTNKQASTSGNLKRVDSNESCVKTNSSKMQDFKVYHDNNSQFSEEPVTEPDIDEHGMYENVEIRTLEDALTYFGLYTCLQQLDTSLEDVRRRRITKKNHQDCFNKIDKYMKYLSLTYHNDAVLRRRGTKKEIERAHRLQSMLNAVRRILKDLNTAFLADIETDHKFKFYSKLNFTFLSNEKDVNCRTYETKFKLSIISKIKQKNVIFEIRQFLIESKKCLLKFIQNKREEFKKSCCSVFFQLNLCIEGFEKMFVELEKMEKDCNKEKFEHLLSLFQNMSSDIKRDLELLCMLEKSAKSSMNGCYEFFSTNEFIDPYFVSPLVWYTNVIIMCKIMSKDFALWEKSKFQNLYYPKFNIFSDLEPLYYLTLYYSKNVYEDKVRMILNKRSSSRKYFKIPISKIEIISRFHEILEDAYKNAEIFFDVNHYTEVMTSDTVALGIEKCVLMMDEFEKQKQDVSVRIKEFKIKTEEMKQPYNDIEERTRILKTKIDAVLEAEKNKIEELSKASKKINENSQ